MTKRWLKVCVTLGFLGMLLSVKMILAWIPFLYAGIKNANQCQIDVALPSILVYLGFFIYWFTAFWTGRAAPRTPAHAFS